MCLWIIFYKHHQPGRAKLLKLFHPAELAVAMLLLVLLLLSCRPAHFPGRCFCCLILLSPAGKYSEPMFLLLAFAVAGRWVFQGDVFTACFCCRRPVNIPSRCFCCLLLLSLAGEFSGAMFLVLAFAVTGRWNFQGNVFAGCFCYHRQVYFQGDVFGACVCCRWPVSFPGRCFWCMLLLSPAGESFRAMFFAACFCCRCPMNF